MRRCRSRSFLEIMHTLTSMALLISMTTMALMTFTSDYFTFPGKVVIQCEHINKADFTAASGFKAMVEDFEGRKQPVKIKFAQSDFCLAKSYLTFPRLVRISSSYQLQDLKLTLTDFTFNILASGVLAEPGAKADDYNEVGRWTFLQSDYLPEPDCQDSRSEVKLQNLMKNEMKCYFQQGFGERRSFHRAKRPPRLTDK